MGNNITHNSNVVYADGTGLDDEELSFAINECPGCFWSCIMSSDIYYNIS